MHAFTIDVEDYYHVSGFEDVVRRSEWNNYESRVVPNTLRLLDLLDESSTKATCFVLGWVAESFPHLVAEIASRGHEVGSHGFWHRLVHTQTQQEFEQDLNRSIELIGKITGTQVTSYRAPSFSFTEKTPWLPESLVQAGIKIDSSVVPRKTTRGGYSGAGGKPHAIKTPDGTLHELPISVVRGFGRQFPLGGGYFRFLPFYLVQHEFRRAQKDGTSLNFYIHPWEIDPEQPRIKGGKLSNRFRHYCNLANTMPRLKRLVKEFRFGRLSETYDPASI